MATPSSSALPPNIVRASDYPKLDDQHLGHLRHIHNLVSQPDGDWNYFFSEDGQDEFEDAKRYQLATMCYALGVAHYHRLPALRGAFHKLMLRVIERMLRKEVWGYRYLASHSGKLLDPDLPELRKPWADPVVRENIMYSGHLLLMTSLFAMLFGDARFEEEGSLVFRWDPLFWGMGPEEFKYDNRSLARVILKQMEENEWVGVCCEPNAVFVVCNQFPLIAMKYNDSRDGTNEVEDVILPKYRAALEAKGMIGPDKLYARWYAVKQKRTLPAAQGAHTAWANAFMHAWNSELVRPSYEKQTLGFLTHIDGKTQLQAGWVALAFRHLVHEKGYVPTDKTTLTEARNLSGQFNSPFPLEAANWMAFTMMLSELGKTQELKDVLEDLDRRLKPTWVKGGLFYPRNHALMDDEGNLTHMDPHSGNAGIAYARLNVPDGQKTMWAHPWTRDVLAARPWVDGDGFGEDIDFLRGIWDEGRSAMVVTVRRWEGPACETRLLFKNVPAGKWVTVVGDQIRGQHVLLQDGKVEVVEMVGSNEVDIVVQKTRRVLAL